MNKKFIIFLSALVTLMLGPGAGHLLLKQWKKAIFFISLSFGLFLILGINFLSDMGQENITAILNLSADERFDKFKDLYVQFQNTYDKTMLFFDVCFAAVWAYSIVDIFISAKNNITQGQQK